MGEFTDTVAVKAPPGAVFAYLADVNNLPHYFDRMRSAAATGREEVHTTAELPDGREVEGEAWFRVNDADQRVEWGSEGASRYHGHVDVRSADGGSEVEVHLHTERVDDGDRTVQEGIARTLASIRAQLERS